MPEEGVSLTPSAHLLTTDEVIRLAGVFVAHGIDKIRLTGGEPTLRKDVVAVCARLAALPGLRTLAMTTNGLLLDRHMAQLQGAGLTHLNISLDTLRRERFPAISRRPVAHWDRVMANIMKAVEAGFTPLKAQQCFDGGAAANFNFF
jgi:cyclic pyranopterin phosphate synthase